MNSTISRNTQILKTLSEESYIIYLIAMKLTNASKMVIMEEKVHLI